jgi:hypothetical protein
MAPTMNTPAQNEPSVSPAERAAALAASVSATLRLAHALVDVQRGIDLAGLEHETGRLCAAALDLPQAEGQALRPRLVTVLAELDALVIAVASQQEREP